jgi:hypothetical protein
MAAGHENVAPRTAMLYRRCASDPLALSLVPDPPTWDMPHRLLAAARWLVLSDEVADFEEAPDPWPAFRAALAEHGEWIARFVREHTVQTNDVQRCWVLLPLFLTIARQVRRPLDLVELGPSAGLNLLWDRYGYAYSAGSWGDPRSPLQLQGEERSRVPAELLETAVEVSSRLGIDLAPVDATTDEGVRLLDAFVRRDDYRSRVRRAAEVVRREPPELVRGDYLEVLPRVLRRRNARALTVVFQTISTVYLSDEERVRLRVIIEEAGAEGPLAWISTPTPEEHGEQRGDYPLELALWPAGERRIVARMNVRGEWLEWIG